MNYYLYGAFHVAMGLYCYQGDCVAISIQIDVHELDLFTHSFHVHVLKGLLGH